MIKLKVFLFGLSVLVPILAIIVGIEIYSMERALARGIFHDVMDEMQNDGYLDQSTSFYYGAQMDELGWHSVGTDYFQGTYPRNESNRARKELQQNVRLVISIRPSVVTRWVHFLKEGEGTFTFSSVRPSEYYHPEW